MYNLICLKSKSTRWKCVMDPKIGVIILAIYPIVLVGALILFGKYSKKPD